jgi:coenzyme Q-binding protein COQ10
VDFPNARGPAIFAGMIHYKQTRQLPYPLPLVRDIILDVKSYPDFLPWVAAAHVYNMRECTFDADLTIGYKVFRETYTSAVEWVEEGALTTITARCYKGLFEQLESTWRLTQQEQGPTHVEFTIAFELSRGWMAQLLKPVFHEAATRMMEAFEARIFHFSGNFFSDGFG